jgi:hypothetical protein
LSSVKERITSCAATLLRRCTSAGRRHSRRMGLAARPLPGAVRSLPRDVLVARAPRSTWMTCRPAAHPGRQARRQADRGDPRPCRQVLLHWMHLWSDGLARSPTSSPRRGDGGRRRRKGWAPFWRYRALVSMQRLRTPDALPTRPDHSALTRTWSRRRADARGGLGVSRLEAGHSLRCHRIRAAVRAGHLPQPLHCSRGTRRRPDGSLAPPELWRAVEKRRWPACTAAESAGRP